MKNKKGISPVIATVLLIVMVVIIALIVFLWFKELTQESITKFGGKNIELVCDEIDFQAEYFGGTIVLTNLGNVPIYKMKMKIYEGSRYETRFFDDNWHVDGLLQGGIHPEDVSGDITPQVTKIAIIPVLIGVSEGSEKEFTCDEKRHGKNIFP